MSTFDDLDAFVATRRCAGLALSPDGTRLVTTVSELSADGKKYGTSLWELDPAGERAPRRLTRSSTGESSATFTPAGDLLFTSRRADPTAEKPTEDRTALWLLPARGGEARPVAERPGGVSGFAVARDAGTLALVTPKPVEGDAAEQREARETAGVAARLHTQFPVRFWDHDLGPGRAHLQRCAPPDPADPDAGYGEPEHVAPGADHRFGGSAISPDGRTVAVVAEVPDADDPASWRRRLELHTEDGRVVVGDEPGADHEAPTITPDGRWLLWVRERHPRPGRGMAHTLKARSLEDGSERRRPPRGSRPGPGRHRGPGRRRRVRRRRRGRARAGAARVDHRRHRHPPDPLRGLHRRRRRSGRLGALRAALGRGRTPDAGAPRPRGRRPGAARRCAG